MIDNSKVKEIIEYCKTNNMDVTARDVAYVAMTKVFEDNLLAYKVIFGMDSGFNIEYANMSLVNGWKRKCASNVLPISTKICL